jgi:predicted MFS family arabinose efflux permease
VVAIALGSFALVFSELIPVGLLADISGHLGVSIGTGGLMVVVPAVTAAVAAPLLTLCSARLERRAVLVALSALVSERARGTAMAVVSSGIFLATVASLPAGSLIGTLTTWRAAFAVAAVFAVIAVAVWGLGYGAVPVAAQSWMARAMPANVEGGLALFVSALQGSLAAASAVGGIVYDAEGPGGTLVLAGVVAGRAGRSGRRTGPGRAGPAARRNRSSSKQCMTTTLTSPFAAIPRPRPERKELP